MVSQPEPPEPVTPTAAGRMETSDYGSRSVNRQERKKEKKEDSRAAAVASGLTAAAWLELRAVSEQAEDTEAAATAWSELKLDVGAGGDGRSWKHAAEEEVAFQYMNDTIAAALASSPEVKAERRQSGGFSDDGMDEDPVAAAQVRVSSLVVRTHFNLQSHRADPPAVALRAAGAGPAED